jgi:hypothetical protein
MSLSSKPSRDSDIVSDFNYGEAYPNSVKEKIATIEKNNPLNNRNGKEPPPKPPGKDKRPLHEQYPDEYIYNPASGKSVKRAGPTGKALLRNNP